MLQLKLLISSIDRQVSTRCDVSILDDYCSTRPSLFIDHDPTLPCHLAQDRTIECLSPDQSFTNVEHSGDAVATEDTGF